MNRHLFRFKSYLAQDVLFDETIDHLFVYIVKKPETRNLYLQIKTWLSKFNINMPEQSLSNVILGPEGEDDCPLINHILLMFKIVIYKARNKEIIPNLNYFINYLKQTQKIEAKIAQNRNKMKYHNRKWRSLKPL